MIRKKPVDPKAACLRMAGLCARGEHCEMEIREKLRKMLLPTSAIDEIIDYLIENRYIDDQRFAAAFTRDKLRFSQWGRRKIQAALRMKRIPSADIDEAFEEIDPEEYFDILYRVATAKTRNAGLELSLPDDRAKLMRHLAAKGFEFEVISRAITRLRQEQSESEEDDSED